MPFLKIKNLFLLIHKVLYCLDALGKSEINLNDCKENGNISSCIVQSYVLVKLSMCTAPNLVTIPHLTMLTL